MRCVIYRSRKKDEMYLFVPKKKTGEALADDDKGDLGSVPEALLEQMGPLVFVMELELAPERSLARSDPEEVREGLRNRGFYLQMPPSDAERLQPKH
jgi:uncharacterized protein YcgL (UPF0745 family)